MATPTFTLTDLDAALRTIGRGVVFYATYWDETTDLAMTHLGDTEGDISLAMNEAFSHLTLPELTGPAKHKSYVDGLDPVLSVPIFIADPALRAIVSPTGTASMGYSRRRPVTEYTLAVFPEELLYDVATKTYKVLTYEGATWKVGGSALTAAQTALLGQSVWLWRGFFSTVPIVFKHGDGGKAVDGTTFQVLHDTTKPDGNRLGTLGDPATAGIDIAPVAS